jgi:hypothetical protein
MLSVDDLKLNQEKVEEAYSDDEEVVDMDIQGTDTRDVDFLDTYRNSDIRDMDIRDTDIQGGFNKKQEGQNINQDIFYEEDDMIGEHQAIKEMNQNGWSDCNNGQEDYYEEEYEEEITTDSNVEVRAYMYEYEYVCIKLHVNI